MKYTKISVLFLLLSTLFVFSCSDKEDETKYGSEHCLVLIDGEYIIAELDKAPEYLDGGEEGYSDTLSKHMKYPALARENGTEGTAIVTFVITAEGTLEEIEIIQDPGDGIADAVVTALQATAPGVAFSPGEIDGQAVNVKKEVPVRFKLEG